MWRSAGRVASIFAVAWVAVVAGGTPAPGAALPDSRGYELVSPPVKNGADVAADSSRTRAAADGSAASFTSLGGFGDVRGTGQATEYVSERSVQASPGGSGWSTHAITPRQDPLSLFAATQNLDSLWVGDFSADLSRGVFRAWSPVTAEDTNVVDIENLYLRSDLRIPGAGSYQLLSSCPACVGPIGANRIAQTPRIAGASADFNHVIFESNLQLTADAGSGPHLYEWTAGALRLAGILPDTACGGAPPCSAARSVAGPGANLRPPHAISSDGSRINFTDTSVGDGQSTGALYQRIDGTQTVQINATEKTSPDPPQPATYQAASVDGKRVFFTTAEQLINDDTDTSIDLYMWEAAAAPSHRLTRLSVHNNASHPESDTQGAIGTSDDGSYVYFVAAGQLVADKPFTGNSGIYVWRAGAVPAISYVGEMGNPGLDIPLNTVGQSSLGGGIRARVTPDGRHMAFLSHTGTGLLAVRGGADVDQTQCPSGQCAEFYLYSADSDSLVCASCNPNGVAPTAAADNWARQGGTLVAAFRANHGLSDDGRWLFFHTDEMLAKDDANGTSDAYEYDADTGKVNLISGGIDPSPSYFMDASADGKNAFFVTRQQLVGWDTDASIDLYDARVEGGFPDPVPPSPTCSGDACKGLWGAPLSPALAVSSLFTGIGDVKATTTTKAKSTPKPKKCRRGFVRKKVKTKVRCVKKRKAKGKRATAHRRAR